LVAVAGALGALVAALPLGVLEVSAAIIGVAREATRTVAARTASVFHLLGLFVSRLVMSHTKNQTLPFTCHYV
jgi:hypothetical protein